MIFHKNTQLLIFLPEDLTELARADAVINSVGLTLSVGESFFSVRVPNQILPAAPSLPLGLPGEGKSLSVLEFAILYIASVSVFRFLQAIGISSGKQDSTNGVRKSPYFSCVRPRLSNDRNFLQVHRTRPTNQFSFFQKTAFFITKFKSSRT
ncbi:hypothetical protein TNCV_4599521 [Trichonephila clavipes]|nr:hypothetical protein TNCV_4599521 [Trichonephila clavipes]